MIWGDILLVGPLADPALRRIVLGADVPVTEITLLDRGLFGAIDVPLVVIGPGDGARAVRLSALPPEARDRLDFFCAAFEASAMPLHNGAARALLPQGAQPGQGAPFDAEVWARDEAAITRCAAEELMEMRGQMRPRDAGARWPVMRARAASTLRARAPRVPGVQPAFGRANVRSDARRTPYSLFFSVIEDDLRFASFEGGQSPLLARAAFVMCDAVTVLPYDPVRDRVLLVEQFRYGPYVRGDVAPWLLEPVAGRIDPGESPEDAARREAEEEARLTLGALHKVADYYPSPGAVTEYLYSYVAECDLPDDIEGVAGLADEAEDIRSQLMSFDALMALITSGEATNGPLILSAYWLAASRERLRAAHR